MVCDIGKNPAIAMRVVDWWEADTEENFYNNFFIKLLQKKYAVIYSDTPDYILYGPFGYTHLQYDCIRIFYTGENLCTDWNIADYGIDFDYITFGDRHLRMPLYPLHCNEAILTKHLMSEEKLKQKKDFCAFVVSHGGNSLTEVRDACFEILSQYKQVDSIGNWKNNIEGRRPALQKGSNAKIAYLSTYKFNLCFENSSYPGYLTEKCFEAFAAGCIPIYWGDSTCSGTAKRTPYTKGMQRDIEQYPSLPDAISPPPLISME